MIITRQKEIVHHPLGNIFLKIYLYLNSSADIVV